MFPTGSPEYDEGIQPIAVLALTPNATPLKPHCIVYEDVPERTRIFRLDATQEQAELLAQCHGKFINVNLPEDLVDPLLALVKTLESSAVFDTDAEKKETQKPIRVSDGIIIITGFIM